MSVRQYIGARYVLKVYENTLDPSSPEWQVNVNYEPLTLVTFNYGSYISKKDVPASVGNPADNPEYWAQNGSYNGQIAQINNELDEINADAIIFIGDSYGTDAAVGGDSWSTLLSSVYPDATYLIQGGTGFASDTFMGVNWLDMLTTYVTTLSPHEKNSVKQVIVVGGANDGNAVFDGTTTTAVVKSRIESFCSYAAANLPNATIKCCFIGWNRDYGRHPAYLSVRDVYAEHYYDNYAYISNGENIMRCNDFIQTGDKIHPTVDASKYLAAFINSMATSGDYKLSRSVEATVSAIPENPCTYGSIDHVFVDYDANTCSITVMGNHDDCFHVVFPAATTLAKNATFTICELSGTPVGAPSHGQYTTIPCLVYDDGGNLLGAKNVMFTIQDNKLIAKLQESASVQWRDSLIPWFTIQMNLRNS